MFGKLVRLFRKRRPETTPCQRTGDGVVIATGYWPSMGGREIYPMGGPGYTGEVRQYDGPCGGSGTSVSGTGHVGKPGAYPLP